MISFDRFIGFHSSPQKLNGMLSGSWQRDLGSSKYSTGPEVSTAKNGGCNKKRVGFRKRYFWLGKAIRGGLVYH